LASSFDSAGRPLVLLTGATGYIDEAPDAYDKFDKRIDGYTKILIKFGEKRKAA
jgi:hypothetical protein